VCLPSSLSLDSASYCQFTSNNGSSTQSVDGTVLLWHTFTYLLNYLHLAVLVCVLAISIRDQLICNDEDMHLDSMMLRLGCWLLRADENNIAVFTGRTWHWRLQQRFEQTSRTAWQDQWRGQWGTGLCCFNSVVWNVFDVINHENNLVV